MCPSCWRCKKIVGVHEYIATLAAEGPAIAESDRNVHEASTISAAARLIEYAHGAFIALPPHTTLEIIEHPVFLVVPGAANYAYGLMPWQGRHIPLIDLDAVQRAHESLHRTAAPRYALVVAYQSAPYAPL